MNTQRHILFRFRTMMALLGLMIGLFLSATQAQAQLPDLLFNRLYNGGPQTHFYTTSAQNAASAIQMGFISEGPACTVWSTTGNGRLPIYRLYNIPNGDHYYTLSAVDRDYAAQHLGYIKEGTEGFAYPYQIPGTYPVHQLYRPYESPGSFLWFSWDGHSADHLYTMSMTEVNYVTQHLGYQYNGPAFYAYPAP